MSAPIIDQSYVASEPTILIFKEKLTLMSEQNPGKVLNEAGDVVFTITAKNAFTTLSKQRFLKDKSGEIIGSVRRRKTPSLSLYAIYIGTKEDEKMCQLKSTGSINPTTSNANLYLADDTHLGKAEGNWRAKEYTIPIGEKVIKISRKTSFKGTMLDTDAFTIEIPAGMCQAFAVMIAMALDEMYEEKI